MCLKQGLSRHLGPRGRIRHQYCAQVKLLPALLVQSAACGLFNADVYSDIYSQSQAPQRPLEIVIIDSTRVAFSVWNSSAAIVPPMRALTELRTE